jgi:hypothetical protein
MTDLGKNVGQFIAGSFTKLLLRQKSDQIFEIGQLLIAGYGSKDYTIYQINDLRHGSQIPLDSLELMAGYKLERDESNLMILEPELRNYVLALARPLIRIRESEGTKKMEPFLPKTLPRFFETVYEINNGHLKFLEESELDNPIPLGQVRSGSKVLDTTISLEARDVLTHHVLIPATTGRGKSNLVKVILYNLMENEECGKLVFDPHNEYYEGLHRHPKSKDYLVYYTPRDHVDKIDLKFNVGTLTPGHIMGAIDLTKAQREALIVYHRRNREDWIQNIFSSAVPKEVDPKTINALRRKLGILLNFEVTEDDSGIKISEHGIYLLSGYKTTVLEIIGHLKKGKTVVIDTSLFTGAEEIFIATIIVQKLFNTYKNHKFKNELHNFPIISIVLEEAPRVIGRKALEVSENIFGTIAKEGRKFNIGLIAITQLPSIIEREILANMNTKIILGNEMGPERKAIIESAAQDLSDDYQNIGSLDKGEAIITSNFSKFAVPIKIPLFEDLVATDLKKRKNEPENIKKRSPF